jgi:anti-anti-sigma factor
VIGAWRAAKCIDPGENPIVPLFHRRNQMDLTTDQAQGRVAVTILRIQGALDASNYEQLIAKGAELYRTGTRYLLIDMTDMPFMSSSGLVALHSIALLLRGEQPPDREMGWQAFHAIGHDRDSGVQPHVKLLNPQPKIRQTLQMTSMDQFFAIYPDLPTAIASF